MGVRKVASCAKQNGTFFVTLGVFLFIGRGIFKFKFKLFLQTKAMQEATWPGYVYRDHCSYQTSECFADTTVKLSTQTLRSQVSPSRDSQLIVSLFGVCPGSRSQSSCRWSALLVRNIIGSMHWETLLETLSVRDPHKSLHIWCSVLAWQTKM